jgi:acyl-CoA synthetase (AMP-forming)/AMP-acid ligase II
LSKELQSEFADICKNKSISLIIMYGQTEASPRMAYLPWEYAKSKLGSIGIAIPGGHFWLEDSDAQEIKSPETVGELIYQGKNVALGYAESRFDLGRGDDNKGILHTGDMAKRDAEGFYYIIGRKNRFLKLFGSRINLDEVESLLRKEKIDCACSGEDDHLQIYITDSNVIEKTMQFLMVHTGINRNAVTLTVIDEMPRNESGKILYSALK